jgi:glycosyltransferase involved in cell wall biosynthesis
VIAHLGLAKDRVVVIHPGVDLEIFQPVDDARQQLLRRYPALTPFPGPWLLYVGSELPRKNLAMLFQAVTRVSQAHPGLCLLKVGPAGGSRFRQATLASLAAQGAGEVVVLFEEVSDQELALFYSGCDILVHPSRLEGFGFPLLEAMACDMPVVCLKAGALPEIVGDAAIVVDPARPEDLAEAIESLLGDGPLRMELAARGRMRASTFRWQTAVDGLIEVYREC